MGFRFRRSIKIAPGIRLNLSKTGVSTTIGGRGASVNVGRRGVYANAGIPGTGLSYREKVGGGGRSGSVPAGEVGSSSNGCAGCGCLSLLGLGVLVAMCSGPSTPAPDLTDPPSLSATSSTPTPSTDPFYLHGAMRVRTGPGTSYAIAQTLERGTRVELGPKDSHGWAQVFIAGMAAGYLYRASDLVQTSPPPREQAPAYSSQATGYYTGPRGGCYTYSASGRKRYVDHSYCR